ncbi:hypothetical protein QR685DRAFT_518461 [Neurospora intermedia]|uniref:Secreted protein n=1 Tax=Neurospora intermedia TaxID=5142 RepID=A0ABR3DMZ5_NEUIN
MLIILCAFLSSACPCCFSFHPCPCLFFSPWPVLACFSLRACPCTLHNARRPMRHLASKNRCALGALVKPEISIPPRGHPFFSCSACSARGSGPGAWMVFVSTWR